eukprot:2297430-Rhodomonas_salina.2
MTIRLLLAKSRSFHRSLPKLAWSRTLEYDCTFLWDTNTCLYQRQWRGNAGNALKPAAVRGFSLSAHHHCSTGTGLGVFGNERQRCSSILATSGASFHSQSARLHSSQRRILLNISENSSCVLMDEKQSDSETHGRSDWSQAATEVPHDTRLRLQQDVGKQSPDSVEEESEARVITLTSRGYSDQQPEKLDGQTSQTEPETVPFEVSSSESGRKTQTDEARNAPELRRANTNGWYGARQVGSPVHIEAKLGQIEPATQSHNETETSTSKGM